MIKKTHVSFAEDGAIVEFTGSAYAYMKVCDCDGHGGVIKLQNGEYIPIAKLNERLGLNPNDCYIIAENLDKFYALFE